MIAPQQRPLGWQAMRAISLMALSLPVLRVFGFRSAQALERAQTTPQPSPCAEIKNDHAAPRFTPRRR
jgi:energy-converting hydrogenase Eha subunit F